MYSHLTTHVPAQQLETALGDPYGDGLFGYARRIAEDECEHYPMGALCWLDDWGMQHHYVPSSAGGSLQDFETLFSLVRTISRRDITVTVSHAVSFLGSAGIWIKGSQLQKAEVGRRLLGGERISLALTEHEHGGDLLSIQTQACSKNDRHVLRGDKWMINGASKNSLISVLARSSMNGGARGLSLFLFDKQAASPGSFECLDKIATLGVRGADVSGIRFHDAALNDSDRIGTAGEGFEIVLKGLQLSRMLCGAISLGAAETAFQVALDFSLERRVYQGRVFDIPLCRRLLVESWVDLLLCDCLLTAAARSLHYLPGEASVHSAVVKYLIPHILEHTLKQLSVVLGARYYLRKKYHAGIFQKMLRDSSLVSLFDGSSVVNLYSLITQFQSLSRSWKEKRSNGTQGPASLPCKFENVLPEFDWNGLCILSGGHNCFMEGLPASVAAARSTGNFVPCGVAIALQHQADLLETAANRVMTEIGSIRFGSPHAVSSEAFDKAGEYCAVQGGAMVLQMWMANRRSLAEHLADGHWLVLALSRLNACLENKIRSENLIGDVAERLLQCYADSGGWPLSRILGSGSASVSRSNQIQT